MNFREFINVIKKQIEEQLPKDIAVRIHSTHENNDTEKVGLIFTPKDETLSQTIYLEEYYNSFQKEENLTAIVNSILYLYENIRVPNISHMKSLIEYANVKDKIVYRLVNAKKNQDLLNAVPHRQFHDLAIIYYILLEANNEGSATILIRNSQMQEWGINVQELHKVAHNNTKQDLKIELKNMNEMMWELMGDDTQYITEDPMHVLTNHMRIYGATSLLYDGVFEMIARKMKGSYYVLPSSIHEIIVLPESAGVSSAQLKDMVIAINKSQVKQEEMLSNNVYYCDVLEQCELKIV